MTAAERETGSHILAAAAELFAERGYKGTTTRAIAERAGVNEVTIFRRFKNKLGVLKALGESWEKSMAGFVVGTLPDQSNTRATLEKLAELEVAQATAFGEVATRLAMDAKTLPEVAEAMGQSPDDGLSGLTTYLAERQAAGDLRPDLDPRVMAEAFFALTSTLVMSRQLLGRATAPAVVPHNEAIGQMLELYLTGIGLMEEKS
jgi:AcrR family transcriptional regulator